MPRSSRIKKTPISCNTTNRKASNNIWEASQFKTNNRNKTMIMKERQNIFILWAMSCGKEANDVKHLLNCKQLKDLTKTTLFNNGLHTVVYTYVIDQYVPLECISARDLLARLRAFACPTSLTGEFSSIASRICSTSLIKSSSAFTKILSEAGMLSLD